MMAASLIPATMVLYAGWNWYRCQQWQEAEAMITSADAKTTRRVSGRPGRRTRTTLSVTYDYQWEGKTRHGSQVSPFDSLQFLASSKRDEARNLQNAMNARKPVPCYVNPANGTEVYLNREFRTPSFAMGSGATVLLLFVGLRLVLRPSQR